YDTACGGTVKYTYTYTGCSGTPQDWVYTYTITPPTFTVPGPQGSTVACASNALTAPTVPTVVDNCGRTITPSSPVIAYDTACGGTVKYTYTYTGCSGTPQDWVYTYTITPPTFTVPGPQGSTVACASNALTAPTVPTVVDNCGRTITPSSPVIAYDTACGGTVKYTYTYTGCSGTPQDWVYTYTITPPTFTVPGPQGSTVACASNALTAPTVPTVVDNCGRTITPSSPVIAYDTACGGTVKYTYTYTGCSGTPQDWVYTYTITPPTFTVPGPQGSTVACASNALTAPTVPTVVDNCGRTITPSSPVIAYDTACGGTVKYTYTYTGCSGTPQDWVYTYTITPPTFTVPGPQGSTVACASNALTAPTVPTVVDNCGRTITPSSPVIAYDTACGGTVKYTYTYTGCSGTPQDWVYTYTITPPTFTVPGPQGSTVACASNALTAPTVPTVVDNCGRTITPSSPVIAYDTACGGTVKYTYTYTGCSGTPQDWVYTYTITPPTFTVPGPQGSTVACASNALTAPTVPTVVDNCGRTITPSSPVIAYDTACGGTVKYTYTYTGCSCTPQDWVYTYTITPPTFTVPGPQGSTVACASNALTAPTVPTVVDNCGRTITPSSPVIAYDTACGGKVKYTYTYTGCSGTPQDWVYTYTITPPTFTVPGPQGSTVACASNALTAPTVPTVVDNCGRTITPSSPVIAYDTACGGTVKYTYTYTGCSGTPQD